MQPSPTEKSYTSCPLDHTMLAQQKTARVTEPASAAIERAADGVWHVRNFAAARAILRRSDTKQAGFKAELLERLPRVINLPLLYQEGKQHHQQRKQIARFFTPKTVSEHYRHMMETLADQLIARLQHARRADLSQLSMALAVRVAGEVIGLTDSLLPGMDRRLNAFFSGGEIPFSWHPRALASFFHSQLRLAFFFCLDVKPAIQARRRKSREDIISHLIAQGYRNSEILTECVMYSAAGMVTTREFICIAAWHLLEQPALRAQFLGAAEAERYQMLHEILRLEPVVGHLYRRTTADLHLTSKNISITIPQGDLIDVHIYAVNADEAVVGAHPFTICPGREIHVDRVAPSVMGFGDGHHRCLGEFIAIQETDIFLQRLLALDSLRIERAPSLHWDDTLATYELRDFIIALD
jgi:cytochrome P450